MRAFFRRRLFPVTLLTTLHIEKIMICPNSLQQRVLCIRAKVTTRLSMLLSILLLVLAVPVKAQTTVPQDYVLNWLQPLNSIYPKVRVVKMNNFGTIAAIAYTADNNSSRAIMYLNGSSVVVDLNFLTTVWTELASGAPVSGWTATYAYGINDNGVIVGRALNAGVERAFILDTAISQPQFKLMPSPWFEATSINNMGVVIGMAGTTGAVYTPWDQKTVNLGFPTQGGLSDINDRGFIVNAQGIIKEPTPLTTVPYTYTYTTGATKQIANHGFQGINESNVISGQSARWLNKSKVEFDAITYDYNAASETLVQESGSYVWGINDSGDVVWSIFYRGWLKIFPSTVVELDKHVYSQSSGNLATIDDTDWNNASAQISPRCITNRNIFGSPLIAGFVTYPSTRTTPTKQKSFLLTPK